MLYEGLTKIPQLNTLPDDVIIITVKDDFLNPFIKEGEVVVLNPETKKLICKITVF